MSFTIETKLHILLIMTVAGIALYMYLLYKEVKVFQEDIVVIKQQIHQLQTGGSTKCVAPPPTVAAAPDEPKSAVVILEDDDDDDADAAASVTSNEIKDILTNIHDSEDVVAPLAEDVSKMSEEELNTLSYSVLRDYLKNQKLSYKGTKADFIKRILEKQVA